MQVINQSEKQFAVLIPMSVVGEIARLENDAGERLYDPELITAVEKLSRVILAQDAEMWLISIEDHHIGEFIARQKQMEENLHEITAIRESVSKARNSKVNKTLKSDTAQKRTDQESDKNILTHIMLPITRAMASQQINSMMIPLRKRRTIHKSIDKSHEDGGDHHEDRSTLKFSRIKWKGSLGNQFHNYLKSAHGWANNFGTRTRPRNTNICIWKAN
jgi:hypothetical protein